MKQIRKNMRTIISVCFFTLIFTNSYFETLSQSKERFPILINKIEIRGADRDSLWEYGYNLAVLMDEAPSTRLTIRLCSKETFPIAIATASVPPLVLTRFLMSAQNKPIISSNRIFIDRSENCTSKYLPNTTTELWLNNNNFLCNAKERLLPCQVKIQELKSKKDDEIIVGTFAHKKALDKLISELKQDSQKFGTIIGYYVDEPTKEIKKKLSYIKRIIKNKISADRYTIKMMKWTGLPDIKPPKHLDFKLIKIEETCSEINNKNEVIIVD